MPPIDRAEARKCVRKALRAVADFSGSDFEDFTFEHWHAFHRTVFINVVASCISAKGSRLVISEDTLDEVDTVGAFVDWVNHNSAYRGEPESAMAVSEGDLRPS